MISISACLAPWQRSSGNTDPYYIMLYFLAPFIHSNARTCFGGQPVILYYFQVCLSIVLINAQLFFSFLKPPVIPDFVHITGPPNQVPL